MVSSNVPSSVKLLEIIARPWMGDQDVALPRASGLPVLDASCGAALSEVLSKSFKVQLRYWADFNGITGQVSVPVEPGMDFAGSENWWNSKTRFASHGEPEHRGLDLSCLVDNANAITPLKPGSPLIWLASGRIVSIFKDLVGQTIVVEAPEGKELLFYVHTAPAQALVGRSGSIAGSAVGRYSQTAAEIKLFRSLAFRNFPCSQYRESPF